MIYSVFDIMNVQITELTPKANYGLYDHCMHKIVLNNVFYIIGIHKIIKRVIFT